MAVAVETLLVAKPGYRQGRPCLRGTGITVHAVADAYHCGLTVEDMCAENPDLDRSLFYAALAYYFANREQVDAEIQADIDEEREMAARFPHGVTRESLGL
jgi:uncharacterized protein (DUF433 family)